MKHLFIKLLTIPEKNPEHDYHDVSLEWVIKNAENELIGQGNADHRALMDLTGLNGNWDKDFEISVILSNNWAIATSLIVPGKNASQIERALPFAVEEFVSSEVEELHIAKGRIKSGDLLTCHLIDSVVMKKVLDLLDESNISPTRLILESELVPHQNRTVSVFNQGVTSLVKTDHHAIKVHRNNITKAINSLKNDFEDINLLNSELTDLEISELDEPIVFAMNQQNYDENWFALVSDFNVKKCINLLQGKFKREKSSSSLSNESLTLLKVASVAFTTISVFFIAEGFWSQIRADDYEEKAFSIYQSMFPNESLPVTTNALLRRVNSKLNRTTKSDVSPNFLDRVDAVSKSLPENSSLLTMSYSNESQELILIALLKSYDALDEFKNSLTAYKLNMDTSSAEEQGDLVRARIRIRPGA